MQTQQSDDSDNCSGFTVSEEVRESWEEVCIPAKGKLNRTNDSRVFDEEWNNERKQRKYCQEYGHDSNIQNSEQNRQKDFKYNYSRQSSNSKLQRKQQQRDLCKLEDFRRQHSTAQTNVKQRQHSSQVMDKGNYDIGQQDSVKQDEQCLSYVNKQNFKLLMQLNEEAQCRRKNEATLTRMQMKIEKLEGKIEFDQEQLNEKQEVIEYLEEKVAVLENDVEKTEKKNRQLLKVVEDLKRKLVKNLHANEETLLTLGTKPSGADVAVQEELRNRMSNMEQLMAEQLARSLSLQDQNVRLVRQYQDLQDQQRSREEQEVKLQQQRRHPPLRRREVDLEQLEAACRCPGHLLHQCRCSDCEQCRKYVQYREVVKDSATAYYQ